MRNLIFLLLFLFCGGQAILPAQAAQEDRQDCPSSTCGQQGIWGERGISRRFVVRGDLLYAADGRGVSVYDVANPAAIRRIDVESGDAESRDLAFIGSTDLVVATSVGLDRFSVNADGTLQRLESTAIAGVTRVAGTSTRVSAASGKTITTFSRFENGLAIEWQRTFSGTVRALATSGNVLYAAVERSAIHGFDATTGETLHTFAVDAVGLAVSGSTLWAAADIRGLFAIDLAKTSVAGVAGAGETRFADVAAAGTRVYAIEAPNRVHVFDGSKPSEPKLVATIEDWVNVIGAGGTRLYLAGAILDAEELPYETGVPVRVYDAANLSAPVQAGEFRDLAGPISGVWTDGSLAYVIDAPFLRIMDLSKTAEPRELGSIVIPNLQDWIRVRNGLAINYGRTRVNLLDVSSPRRPKVIGSWDTRGHAPSAAAFARDTIVEANRHSGLHIVDYGNPANMVQIAGRQFHYLDLIAADDAVYTIQQATLLTIDLTDRFRVVDSLVHHGQYFQVDTTPTNAAFPHHVVTRAGQGIAVFSLIENRFKPKFVALVPMSDPGLFGTNETSVLVTKDGLLHRLDVANPTGFTPTDMAVTSPMQISAVGGKVVIADRYRLRVYGPDTPPVPAERGRRRAVGKP